MAISLAGRTVIITGAAQDVGRVMAQRFLDAGARVMLADWDEKALAGAKAAMEGDEDRLARFHYVAQDRLSVANLIAATVERFGRIDSLVNGAQTISAPGAFLDLGTEQFDAAFGSNVRSVFQLSQAVARRMIAQAGDAGAEERTAGAIVNISSIAAIRTVPELLTFSVSCAALDQLTRSMAASLAPHGIRVNGIALGGILTDRLRAAFRDNEALREDMIRATPLGRLADIEEAAEAALFAASDHASYITGQVIAVDGGRTLLDPLASPVR
ncbi:MAG TPA: SDR family oxidoreductase [Paracoccaceae bacterium]|nr:SDR family oxidoreductase [Paracoccaceae bacterium]